MFIEIPYASEAYYQAFELRQAVLRKPFGFDLNDEDLTQENSYRHFGLQHEETVIACLIAIPKSFQEVQFRQMAVDPHWQGKGLGRQLLQSAENTLLHEGIQKIWLNARQKALGFYLKMGYQSVGEKFYELNIPHYKMEKYVSVNPTR